MVAEKLESNLYLSAPYYMDLGKWLKQFWCLVPHHRSQEHGLCVLSSSLQS